MLGLVGESGAGKSMLGRTVAQLLPPGFCGDVGGSLSFGGAGPCRRWRGEAAAACWASDIAFIPQEPLSALNPVLTVGQQFDEHLARLGIANATERRTTRTLAAFDAVHLPHGEELLERYPHQLSGGMCQRVLIAMAFASKPRLVIADEPTTALDVTHSGAHRAADRARCRSDDDTAVVFITHDLRLAAHVCDDILVLYAGRPVEYGPRAACSCPAHPYTRCLQLANPPMSGARRALHLCPNACRACGRGRTLPGCAFAPRCPIVIAECNAAPPPVEEIEPGPQALPASARRKRAASDAAFGASAAAADAHHPGGRRD